MKKLYYTTERHKSTGRKEIRVYTIENNIPALYLTTEAGLSDCSKQAIQNYLSEQGDAYDYELIYL